MPVHADLHTHSKYSDGTAAPAEVVRRARVSGVSVLVLTDHDTLGGVAQAREAAKAAGIRFGAGIEINTAERDMAHVLGYGIDPENKKLLELLAVFRARRDSRIGKIVQRLRDAGVDITMEEVQGASTESLGRPHVADALRRKKIVHSRSEAFQKYLSQTGSAYVPPMGPTVAEAIAAIKAAGGWASLAHPLTVGKDAPIGDWVDMGLEGIEAYYGSHTGGQVEKVRAMAAKYKLLETGGSDYHGPGTGRERVGGVAFPDDVFARFAERLNLS